MNSFPLYDFMTLGKYKHIAQWNKIENPEIDHYKCSELISDKEVKGIKWSKNSVFHHMMVEKLNVPMQK